MGRSTTLNAAVFFNAALFDLPFVLVPWNYIFFLSRFEFAADTGV